MGFYMIVNSLKSFFLMLFSFMQKNFAYLDNLNKTLFSTINAIWCFLANREATEKNERMKPRHFAVALHKYFLL